MVPNPGAVLRPGLFVTAELQLDAQQTELYVPEAAVRNRGDVAAVFVVRGGVVREQIVSVGSRPRAASRSSRAWPPATSSSSPPTWSATATGREKKLGVRS